MAFKTIRGIRTLPLNDWRTRTLADFYFGSKTDADKFYEGMRFALSADIIKNLPEFDEENQAYADSFDDIVVCEVMYIDRTYGMHISIEKSLGISEMNDKGWGRWASSLKSNTVKNMGSPSTIGIYWKDVRPEDFIMEVPLDSIRGAKVLESLTTMCRGYWCRNDLIFRICQLYGDRLNSLIEKAGAL
jgi:hypothetical protein